MDSTPRARIVSILSDAPGASTRMVAEALALDESTTDYHLRRLTREGKVQRQRQGREQCWFNATCGLCPVLLRAVPAFRRDETMKVAVALDDLPRPATDVAQRTGVPVSQVRWAFNVLETTGVARRTALGRMRLQEGGGVCIRKALDAERCDLWGACPVSRALEARERAGSRQQPT